MIQKIKKWQQGFTLLEMIMYTAILVLISGIFVSVLVQVLKIANNQNSSAEVSTQLNYAVENINLAVRSSSLVDLPADASTSTLVLKTADECKDTVKIYLSTSTGIGIIKQDTIPYDAGLCFGQYTPSINLTTDKINVTSLNFKKNTFYPGHDQVTFDVNAASNLGNPQSITSRILHGAVSRVSAATFDSSLIAGSDTYNIGIATNPWGKIFVKTGGGGTGGGINETLFFSSANDGNVGIKNQAPSYPLDVLGNAYVSGTIYANGGTWNSSDIRFKTNIEKISGALDKIINLNGIYYNWKTKEFPAKEFPQTRQIGLIAQEVEKQFPELVSTDKDGYKLVSYDKLVAILLESIKELNTKVDKQQSEIDDLRARIENLENLQSK